jgi:hypothetical protein
MRASARDYIATWGLCCIFTQHGRIGATGTLERGMRPLGWAATIEDAQAIADVMTATGLDVVTAAKALGITKAKAHAVLMERVEAVVAHVERTLAQAKASGHLHAFNRAFAQRRCSGGPTSYQQAYSRLRAGLFRRMAVRGSGVTFDRELFEEALG